MTHRQPKERNKSTTLSPTSHKLYGNISVYSPDDIFMFYANQRKMRFYIQNDLVEKVGENSYRLKFTPDGLGFGDSVRYAEGLKKEHRRVNRCVVTGSEVELTRHHVVPKFFRAYMPLKYKNSYQTVVMLGKKAHMDYTAEEIKFYDILSEKYGVSPHSTFKGKCTEKGSVSSIANTLFLHEDRLPLERLEELHWRFRQETSLEPNKENYLKFIQLVTPSTKKKKKIEKTVENHFGMAVMAKVTDFDEFELLWLNHFIECVQPKFLPQDLIEKYKLNLVVSENTPTFDL